MFTRLLSLNRNHGWVSSLLSQPPHAICACHFTGSEALGQIVNPRVLLSQALVQDALSGHVESHQAQGPGDQADGTGGEGTTTCSGPAFGCSTSTLDHVEALWQKHDLQSLASVQIEAMAGMLTRSCLDGAVDHAWMQRHRRVWKMAVRRSIQQQTENIAMKTAAPVNRWSTEVESDGFNKVGKCCLWYKYAL